jgi:LysM repeat protein
MRWRVLLIGSVLLNVTFAVVLLLSNRKLEQQFARATEDLRAPILTNRPRPTVIIRRQFFSWCEVESPDYATYIANLRDIACPESTIRDLIVADVNQLYAIKRATEIVTSEQQWWRSEPDPEIAEVAEAKLQALDEDRRALLTRLLGPNWDFDDATALAQALALPRTVIPLDGPVLGLLTSDVKLQLREVVARQQQRVETYLASLRESGASADPAELARLRQQTRDELTGVLSPPQLEEFLLRYSDNAQSLRGELGQLRLFNTTPEEFRALFRATDALDQQIKLRYCGSDPASVQARTALEQQREQSIKNALGPDRYALYHRLQDPLYGDALLAAQQGNNPNAVNPLYQIAQEAALEQAVVDNDPSLTSLMREIRLKEIELEQLKAKHELLGGNAPAHKPAAQSPPAALHVIQNGDTLERLAAAYGTTVRDILSANGNRDVMRLRPGDPLYLPTPAAPPPKSR